MQIDYGVYPEEPGMEEVYTIIPDDMKMNPDCGCPARTCPNHGFCRYCVAHHRRLNKKICELGLKGHPQFCGRKHE